MKLLLRLILVALLAFGAGAFLLVRENPEARFWAQLRARQELELAQLRSAHPGSPVVLFTGGSSCAFSVDPAIVTAETGRPSVNLGTSAWSGPKYYLHRAFQSARAGDLLVLVIEPNFLTETGMLDPTPLGLALAWDSGDPDAAAGADSFGETLSPLQHLDLLRPGARYLVTWSAKSLAGGERYYYTLNDLRPGGRLETARRHPTGHGDDRVHPGQLTPEAGILLERVAALARQREIRVAYALPWYFTAEASAAANRATRRALLDQIAGIMPVLEDPALGVRTEPGLFSDTNFHLTAGGSGQRSRVLGRSLLPLLGGSQPARKGGD